MHIYIVHRVIFLGISRNLIGRPIIGPFNIPQVRTNRLKELDIDFLLRSGPKHYVSTKINKFGGQALLMEGQKFNDPISVMKHSVWAR